MMRILLYGGSFNPPHNGHVDALRAARAALSPDKTLVIPGCIPPHKAVPAGSPAPEERLELTREAFRCFPEAEVSDMELRRGGVSYSVDTLEECAGLYPGSELFFLMGTDMFLYMEKWYRFRRILELCTLAVLPREEGELSRIRDFAVTLQRQYDARVLVIPKPPLPMDSTSLREALGRREGREGLPEEVYAHIIRRRFYGAQPELSWLRSQAYAWLKPRRIPHVRGCEETAVRLATRWGEKEDRAAEAAILHDITKKMNREEQLRLCGKYSIMTDNVERQEPQLLHAKTGAALARELFGIDDDIYNAILWHTTGRAGMTRLEKIIYLADAMEPTRDYPGVEELRAAAFEDLDRAMALGLEMSLALVRSRGSEPHEHTQQALDWLQMQRN